MDLFIERLKFGVDVFEDEALTPDTDITALLVWDSIALLSVMSVISSEYGVNLTAEEIRESATISKIFDLINSKK